MGKADKLLKRLISEPKDFTYDELKRLLSAYGYEEAQTGKTSGSRVAFINHDSRHIIRLHKPHPHPELKQYQIDDVLEELKRQGILE
ncbi:MAG: type II toxin-antitoxin system HicA family toxin [Proteobacteria bacterium]|nr:type II toxin-antitoxin system HicA family toxin [Pseudomonadota bacterium]